MSVDLLSGEDNADEGSADEAIATETTKAPEAETSETENIKVETPDDGRPEGCPDKFWDADLGELRVDAIVKSYTELEKKLGAESKAREVPESYEFEIPKYDDLKDDLEGIETEDFEAVTSLMEEDCAFNKSMQSRAKKAGVTQDQWKEFARGYVVEQARAHKVSEQQQRKILVDEAGGDVKAVGERIAGIRQKIYHVYRDNPSMKAHAHHMSQTADGIKLLEDVFSGRLAKMVDSGGSSAPIPIEAAKKTALTVADLRKIQSSKKYIEGDAATHKRVAEGYRALEQAGAL